MYLKQRVQWHCIFLCPCQLWLCNLKLRYFSFIETRALHCTNLLIKKLWYWKKNYVSPSLVVQFSRWTWPSISSRKIDFGNVMAERNKFVFRRRYIGGTVILVQTAWTFYMFLEVASNFYYDFLKFLHKWKTFYQAWLQHAKSFSSPD